MNSQKSLIQRIQARGTLTPSEQKISVFFEHHMEQLAFETVTSISKEVGVSKATVVRFIASLGYDGFSDFQLQLRNHLVMRLQPPITRLPLMKENLLPNGENVLEQSFNHVISNLNKTLSRIDGDMFLRVARLIARSKGKVFIDGHRSSAGLAKIFWITLQYFRPKVFLLDASAVTAPDILTDIRETDILVSITHRRYCNATRRITDYFADIGATVVMLTDSELMPYSDKADYKLVISTEGLFVFNSLCSTLAVIESLVIAVAQLCEESAYGRSEKSEKIFRYFDIFATDYKDPLKPPR